MQKDQILDYFEDEVTYKNASKTKRFVNYLVDRVSTFIISMLLLGLFLDNNQLLVIENIGRIGDYLLSAVITVTYYTLCEGLTNGKTIGKLMTGTRAVSLTNEKLDFASVIGRSFARVVPFEAFSFLGDDASGWHDKWSESKVVDEKTQMDSA